MSKRKSIAIIFKRILILGFLVISSCTTDANNGQQSVSQAIPNGAVMDRDASENLGNNVVDSRQQQSFCTTVDMPIPDMGTISSVISIPSTGTPNDLDVYLNIIHTYVGDLKVTLEHTRMVGPVTLIDRLGCGGSDINVTVNDESTDGTIVSQCENNPAIFGNRIGGNPPGPVLSTFYGKDFSGEWVIKISDTRRGDTGTLSQWCLMPTLPIPTGNIEIIQNTVPESPTNFIFIANGLDPSSFVLGDDVNGILQKAQVYEAVDSGTYIVNQTAISGYNTSISCIDPTGDTSTGDYNAIINLAGGETVSCTFTTTLPVCNAGKFLLNRTDAHYGPAGNINNFTVNGVNVHVSGWSRDKTTGIYAPAYNGAYPNGLGVTDLISDGNGSNLQHALDNFGADNYLLFEFDRPVIIDQFHLGYTTVNSDVMVWFGSVPDGVDPYRSPQTLSEEFLNALTPEIYLKTTLSHLVNINAGNQTGNILVIAPRIGDTDDYFKIDKLDITCPN